MNYISGVNALQTSVDRRPYGVCPTLHEIILAGFKKKEGLGALKFLEDGISVVGGRKKLFWVP